MSASAAAVTSSARAWLLASRPATLPAAAVPVIVGAAAAVSESAVFRPLVFAATLLAALLIQIGTNFANDYFDFRSGADHEGRLGPMRVTQSGLLDPPVVRRGIVVAFGAAAALGLYLAWVGGWTIVLIGLFSILCGLAYTGGPWPFGYHGLGDVFVFLFFGAVAVTGTAFLQSGQWSGFALLVSMPIGLLVTNILVVNNLRDIDTDRAARKNTLAVMLGDRGTRIQYSILMVTAYAIPLFLAVTDQTRRWLLLPWLTAPLAFPMVRQILGGLKGRDLNSILERTGRLLLAFGVLFAVGLVVSGTR